MPYLLLLLGTIAVFAVGCANYSVDRIVYPGNGETVIVDIDPELDACPLTLADGTSTTVGAAIRFGIRYWDATGACLRTADQLTHEKVGANARRLHVWSNDSAHDAGTNVATHGEQLAAYRHNYGDVEVHLSRLQTQGLSDFYWTQFVVTFAHETGHALGLDHVTDTDAVMYPNATRGNARDDLADADLKEFTRVWN